MNPKIRWILLLPTTIASVFLVVFVGSLFYYFLFECARTGFVPGMCMLEGGQEIFMMVIAALSAITAVAIAAAIAPSSKIAVAWFTFLTGATIAGLIDKPESFAAITAGLVGIAGVTIFQRNKAPNKSSKRTPQSGAA